MYEYFDKKGSDLVQCFVKSFRELCIGASESNANYNKNIKTGVLCVRRLAEWFKYCDSKKALA